MARFEARTSAASGRADVALTGECDLDGRDALTSALLAAVQRAPQVCVDLGGVTFLDSSGVHSLVSAYHAARQAGGRLYVVNARGAVATVLEITGVGDLLSPPDIEAAGAHGAEDRHHD